MNIITFEDLPDTTTPIDATNLNLLQTNVEDGINEKFGDVFPIGTIYKSVVDTNPSEYFGGTWVSISCRELIESGTQNGIYYEKYSDGRIIMEGTFTTGEIPANSSYDDITLPFNYISSNDIYNVSLSAINGGSYWADVSYMIKSLGSNQIRIDRFNVSGNTAGAMTFSYKVTGYYTTTPTMFAWKKTSDTEEEEE